MGKDTLRVMGNTLSREESAVTPADKLTASLRIWLLQQLNIGEVTAQKLCGIALRGEISFVRDFTQDRIMRLLEEWEQSLEPELRIYAQQSIVKHQSQIQTCRIDGAVPQDAIAHVVTVQSCPGHDLQDVRDRITIELQGIRLESLEPGKNGHESRKLMDEALERLKTHNPPKIEPAVIQYLVGGKVRVCCRRFSGGGCQCFIPTSYEEKIVTKDPRFYYDIFEGCVAKEARDWMHVPLKCTFFQE